MSQHFYSASQPIPSSMPGAVSQGLDASSSLGAFYPSSHSQLQGGPNLLGLNLPPNALRIIAQYQASGRLPPTLFNHPASQPVQGAAKSVSTKTRPTARSHSQPNLRKTRAPSAHRGGAIPQPVAQPSEAAQYQPPPMKARARRAALAAKSKGKETAPAVAGGPKNPIPSWGDRGKTPSMPILSSASAAQVPVSQGKAASRTAPQPVPIYSAVAKTISKQPGLRNIPISLIKRVLPSLMDTEAEVQCVKRSKSWVAGGAQTSGTSTSNSMAQSEGPSPPDMGMPTTEATGLLPAGQPLGPLPPMVQPEPSPLVEQPQSVPATGGGDTGHFMEFSDAIPTVQFPDWYSTTNVPEWEVPATGLPTVEAHTAPLYKPERPSVALQMLDELDELMQKEPFVVATAVNEQSAEEVPSAALECILDLEHSLAVEAARSEEGLTLPTREDFDLSLLDNMGSSAESGRDLYTGEAWTGGVEQFADGFLDSYWEGFVDFECPERV